MAPLIDGANMGHEAGQRLFPTFQGCYRAKGIVGAYSCALLTSNTIKWPETNGRRRFRWTVLCP